MWGQVGLRVIISMQGQLMVLDRFWKAEPETGTSRSRRTISDYTTPSFYRDPAKIQTKAGLSDRIVALAEAIKEMIHQVFRNARTLVFHRGFDVFTLFSSRDMVILAPFWGMPNGISNQVEQDTLQALSVSPTTFTGGIDLSEFTSICTSRKDAVAERESATSCMHAFMSGAMSSPIRVGTSGLTSLANVERMLRISFCILVACRMPN